MTNTKLNKEIVTLDTLTAFNETTFLVINKRKEVFIKKQISKNDIPLFNKLQKINCPQIAKVYNIVEKDGKYFSIQEYVNGISLENYIKEYGCQNDEFVRNVAMQICRGLSELHKNNIVHRDISPKNIIIDGYNNIKIIDFGIARTIKQYQSSDTQILGTQGYAAPEQFGFSQSNSKTDIYSLGVLINVLSTGKFPNETLASGNLKKIVEKCTKIDESNRYNTVDEIENLLKYNLETVRLINMLPGFNIKNNTLKVVNAVYVVLSIISIMIIAFDKYNSYLTNIYDSAALIFMLIVPMFIIYDFNFFIEKWYREANLSKSKKITTIICLIIVDLLVAGVFLLLSPEK